MKIVKFSISLVVCCLIFYLLNFPLGMVPPLAKFFSPFSGFWKNNTTLDKIPEVLDFNGLTDKVIVRWDKRHVPHIFANSNYDLYFMQGYLTARDRLWQMEFQTHAAAGRLSEIIGERTLQYDRFHRRIGLQYAAEKSLQLTMENQQSREALEAYSSGVNEYIRNLEQKNFPLEYKILNYKPEKWTPLKCMLLLKSMAWDLTGYASYRELALTKIKDKLSETRMNQLYPVVPPFTEPVIPEGTKWNFDAFGQKKSVNYDFPTTNFSFDDLFVPHEHNGSNNWVVSGELTANGKPILCNDPHLSLSLPSIWYEIQLSSPDVNVYGFSIPGSPSVIIGFNENIAWGLTNAETDVLDYYEIEFNEKSKETYLSNGKSKSAILRIEEIKVRGSETVSDTIYYTHYGPVVYLENEKPYRRSIPTGAALRWTGHYPSNELLAFLRLNQAKDYDDYVEALIHFECPAQNFAFASSGGDIAIWHNGKLPVRKYGQGRFINDGRNSENDWLGFIPHEQLPHAKNPGQDLPADQKAQLQKNIITQLVMEKVLLQKAKEVGIVIDEDQLNQRVEMAAKQRPDVSEEQWRDFLTKNLIIQTLIQQEVVSKIEVSDEEVQKFYDEQKAQFQEPEQVQASHILIKVAPDASEEEKVAAKEKIDKVLALAKEGQDFAELAKEYSEGPSKDNGGDLGFFPRGAMVKPFEDAVFAMDEGEISDVVETQFGYHIIKLTGKKDAHEVPFDEVKDRLQQGLIQQKSNAEVMAWVENLKAQATIEIMNP